MIDTADFLLELLSEEIPARMQARARADLARTFAEEIDKAGLESAAIETFATPRRLALIARGLPLTTAAQCEEIKGPRASAPPQALEGFLRKTGLTRADLVDRDGVLFATIDRAGAPSVEVLGPIIERIVRGFPWPKAMRWGAASVDQDALRWVRPLHGIVALLGEDIVPVTIAGIASGAASVGHRFHHPGPITFGGAHDYVEKLRACHVIVDHDERAAIIRNRAQALAAEAGLALVEDEGLVAENAGLTEWPVPLLGRFDPDFLDVPREVIVLTMRTNQKYFACTDANGALAPAFVCTANIDANDGGAQIVEGNRRVLAARLSDARFFWEQDLKIPLDEQAKKLSRIVFHVKLGTVADKVERVAKLARWLVEEGIIKSSLLQGRGGSGAAAEGEGASSSESPPLSPEAEREKLADQAERAARLAKADLVTGMVAEFPELQGVIGGYLAAAQGEPKAVSDAIRDHYKPVGQREKVPTAPVTVAVSLADKLDSLVLLIAAGERASGSKDSFGTRRLANGILRISTEGPELLYYGMTKIVRLLGDEVARLRPQTAMTSTGALIKPGYSIFRGSDDERKIYSFGPGFRLSSNRYDYEIGISDIEEDIYTTFALVEETSLGPTEWDGMGYRAFSALEIFQRSALLNFTWQFLTERFRVQQRDAGNRQDLIDAVIAVGIEDEASRLFVRVRALQAFIDTQNGIDLLSSYKRAANILKRESWDKTSSSILPMLPPESNLDLTLELVERAVKQALAQSDFEKAVEILAALRAPIDEFFEHVMVNDDNPTIRARRLNLLARFRDAVHGVADFSRIEG